MKGGRDIERFLRLPKFDFDETGWKDFYSVAQLGRIPAFYRDSIFQHKDRLQEGLEALVKNSGRVREVLEEFLSQTGKFHIKGLNLNIISKVLVAHDPQRWSVYNGPVEDALNSFGYAPTKNASPAKKFIEFTERMGRFKSASGLPDGYALDAFMVDVYQKLKTETGLAKQPKANGGNYGVD